VVVVASAAEERGSVAEGMATLLGAASGIARALNFGACRHIFVNLERGTMAGSPFGIREASGLLVVVVPAEAVAGLLSVKVEGAAEMLGEALSRSSLTGKVLPFRPAEMPPEGAGALQLSAESLELVNRAALALDAFGKVRAWPGEVAGRRVVCYLPEGSGDGGVTGLAVAAYESVEACCSRLAAGRPLRMRVRAEGGTMMWQPLRNEALLFAAGAGEVRPGLAHLQLDRVADALGSAQIS